MIRYLNIEIFIYICAFRKTLSDMCLLCMVYYGHIFSQLKGINSWVLLLLIESRVGMLNDALFAKLF